LYGQVGWLLALEDPINVDGRSAILVDKVRSIRDQSALGDEATLEVDRRQLVASRKRDNETPVYNCQRAR
jgi:hypothetical protein